MATDAIITIGACRPHPLVLHTSMRCVRDETMRSGYLMDSGKRKLHIELEVEFYGDELNGSFRFNPITHPGQDNQGSALAWTFDNRDTAKSKIPNQQS